MIILAVNDLKKSTDFYSHLLGFEIVFKIPVMVRFKISEEIELALYEKDSYYENLELMSNKQAALNSRTELYVHVEDIEKIVDRLDDAGIRKLSELKERNWGDMAAYYEDPDANVVAVACRI